MRGSPLLRAIVAFCAILLLGYPLWRLTHPNAPAAVPTAPPSVGTQNEPVSVRLEFTQTPTRFLISALGNTVWTEESPQPAMERALRLDFPKEGIDLDFTIEWPGDSL